VSDADMVEDQEMELKLINEGDYPRELTLWPACSFDSPRVQDMEEKQSLPL
jgi:hypothetical protein